MSTNFTDCWKLSYPDWLASLSWLVRITFAAAGSELATAKSAVTCLQLKAKNIQELKMGLSLQEQLLKAGLIDKKQLKKADHDKKMQTKKKRKAGDSFEDRGAQRLQQQQAERAKLDQQLNAQRNQQAQQKADRAAAQQLIATNRLPVEEGNVGYHYVAGGKIKRIAVPQTIADQLADGRLGLAMYNRELVLLTAETVQKVLPRDQDAIVAYNDPEQDDDEYPTDW